MCVEREDIDAIFYESVDGYDWLDKADIVDSEIDELFYKEVTGYEWLNDMF